MGAKVSYQDCGNHIAVFLDGNDTELEEKFNSFWNHSATDGELKMVTDWKGYFWTTKEKLMKALTNAHLFRMLNDSDELRENDPDGWAHCCKGLKGGFLPQAKARAHFEFASYEKEKRANFNGWNKKNHSDETFAVLDRTHSLGSPRAEYTSEDAHKCLNQKYSRDTNHALTTS